MKRKRPKEAPPHPKAFNLSRHYNASQLRMDTWNLIKYSVQELDTLRKNTKEWIRVRDEIEDALQTLTPIEAYWAFPGKDAVRHIRRLLERGSVSVLNQAVSHIVRMLVSEAYRNRATALQLLELGQVIDKGQFTRLPSQSASSSRVHYFEVLVVDEMTATEERQYRRRMIETADPEDPFVYNLVICSSFEDGLIAVLLNPNIQCCIIRNSFPFKSKNRLDVLSPYIEEVKASLTNAVPTSDAGVRLGGLIKRLRPELNLFLVSDVGVEEAAGNVYRHFQRVFYRLDNYLELYLSIRRSILERFETPFFSALKDYSQRPTGVFHAMPLSRGNSVFKSHWIQDMVDFYGRNIFLAETSTTSGGLDSLLQPRGSLKRAQELAAKTFGAQQTFFVTNGTSTANKIVMQGLVQPGDIVLVDRNCHKSAHYALMLSGAYPVYLDAYPEEKYSFYGAVPLVEIKRKLLQLKRAGRLDRVKLLMLTNCTFDGLVYHVERVMEEVLAIKHDMVFHWDEAWFGFSQFAPTYRQRTAMCNAAKLYEAFNTAEYQQRYDAFRASFDQLNLDDEETWLKTRLVPDPQRAEVRVYATQSTHKKLSALRQGAMIHVWDECFTDVEDVFQEAFLTHTSTSPNYQILASLDIARRQAEFEGFEFVQKSVETAMSLRAKITDHPLLKQYFEVLTIKDLIPKRFRTSDIEQFYYSKLGWSRMETAWREDEFVLDPTHITLHIGLTGVDGDTFKNRYLMDQFGIQVNKTSLNTVLMMTNIGTTRSAVAHLISVLLRIARQIDCQIRGMNTRELALHQQRVHALTEALPPLPNFSQFHPAFRPHPDTGEGDIRAAFFHAYQEAHCDYLQLGAAMVVAKEEKRPLVSASFVIPYPPGFPVLVPGQTISVEILDFLKVLDVKEIHGYRPELGLRVFNPDWITSLDLKDHAPSNDQILPPKTDPSLAEVPANRNAKEKD